MTEVGSAPGSLCRLRVGGRRLRVRWIPPGDQGHRARRPCLVFLHEGLGSIELWKDFPDRLCRLTGCAGLVYDRRGYGGSERLTGPWTDHYLLEEAAVFLPGVLSALAVDCAVLIGHSGGGTIALIAAAQKCQPVVGVITEAAHIFVEDRTLAGIRRAVRAFETGGLRSKLTRYHRENTDAVFRRWASKWLSPGYRAWNIRVLLPQISCPLLVLQGEEDEYGSAAQVEGIVRQASGPVTASLIPGCGHVPHVQARARVLSEMQRFVAQLTCNSS